MPSQGCWWKFVCCLKRRELVSLQSDLLGEHHVSRYQLAARHETQSAFWISMDIQLMNVADRIIVDAIPRASAAADDIKAREAFKLVELLGRQPLPQQPL